MTQRLRPRRFPRIYASLADALWDRVDKSTGPDGCWLWMECCCCNGYGRFTWESRPRDSHRVAYELTHGPINDPELFVMHACDTPMCCNPAHLRLGTTAENMRDAAAKGRTARGAKHGMAKLTEKEATEVLRRRREGERAVDIATAFGISPSHVVSIAKGRNWGWLS